MTNIIIKTRVRHGETTDEAIVRLKEAYGHAVWDLEGVNPTPPLTHLELFEKEYISLIYTAEDELW